MVIVGEIIDIFDDRWFATINRIGHEGVTEDSFTGVSVFVSSGVFSK
jgi:hypothetical protein